ncbi:MAG: hypothetical protein JRI23_03470 [Deltaproteobacteria bacterium]|nr:hypothetical protein [Deltaproteobacteria bacterium]MBW2530575.1 hypothetical protein [Deltaproteobacteria bacterium]
MKSSRYAASTAWIAIVALLVGCGDADSLYGTPSAVGTGGTSTGAGGTGGTSTGAGGTGGTSTGSGGEGGTSTGAGGTGGAACEPVGHDEDADSVDDACDSCPSYGNEPQLDGDLDGLGDACEAPSDPTLWQTVVSFDPFVDSPAGAWALGDFTHAPDQLQIATPFGAGRDADWQTPLGGAYSVETTLAYQNDEAGWAGVRFGIGAGWWACLVQRVWAVNRFRYDLGLWEFPGTGTQILPRAEVADVGAEPADRPRRIRVHVRPGGNVLCTYDDTDGRHGEVEYQTGNADGLVGLRGYDTQARFLNFVVYQ